jgi:hypothetical protein
MRNTRFTGAKDKGTKRVSNQRNPLPNSAKELETFFFETSGIGPAPRRLSPASALLPLVSIPPTTGLFYDPLSPADTRARTSESRTDNG